MRFNIRSLPGCHLLFLVLKKAGFFPNSSTTSYSTYATRNAEDDETRQVFEALAEAEKAHLDEVSDRLAGSA